MSYPSVYPTGVTASDRVRARSAGLGALLIDMNGLATFRVPGAAAAGREREVTFRGFEPSRVTVQPFA